jgi:uncharacterized protein YajQ (UPF0234 family)
MKVEEQRGELGSKASFTLRATLSQGIHPRKRPNIQDCIKNSKCQIDALIESSEISPTSTAALQASSRQHRIQIIPINIQRTGRRPTAPSIHEI